MIESMAGQAALRLLFPEANAGEAVAFLMTRYAVVINVSNCLAWSYDMSFGFNSKVEL